MQLLNFTDSLLGFSGWSPFHLHTLLSQSEMQDREVNGLKTNYYNPFTLATKIKQPKPSFCCSV